MSFRAPALSLSPPAAPRHPSLSRHHGLVREDPYAWLKDPEWQRVMRDPAHLDPRIRAYLEAENAYADACLAATLGLRRQLLEEMTRRLAGDDESVPEHDGPFLYYRRFTAGAQHPVHHRRRADGGGGEQVILDPNRKAEGRSFFRLGTFGPSPDHRFLAYTTDVTGAESYALHVKDLDRGALAEPPIHGVHGDVVWDGDSRSLYYSQLDPQLRPWRVYRHRLGDRPDEDRLVYQDPDPRFWLDLGRTESGRFILIQSHDFTTTSETHVIDTEEPGPPRLIAAREAGLDYHVSHHGERLVILTNADGAADFKIVSAPLAASGRQAWRDLVAHHRGRLIRAFRVFRHHLVRLELDDGLPRLVVTRLADGAEHEIAAPDAVGELQIAGGTPFEGATLRFSASGLTAPTRTYDYHMSTRRRVLRKRDSLPGGHDPDAYSSRRLLARGHDGETVPVSLVQARATPRDGSAPLLLHGYGAYGLTLSCGFSAQRLSLLDRGVVYAIAHVRGGSERGTRWYLDGKQTRKRNSFLDYIAAAEHLIAEGYTASGRIAAQGRSAGGLLVGAVMNLRPELFRAVVAEVPFVDVLATLCDPALPFTPQEWAEWGDPLADAEVFRYIESYSPYDNVRPQAYPHVLVLAGLTDPRVTYWEPAKWVAKLRHTKRDDNLVLLRTNMEAGHLGAAGRFDRLEEVALIYGFLLQAFGLAR